MAVRSGNFRKGEKGNRFGSRQESTPFLGRTYSCKKKGEKKNARGKSETHFEEGGRGRERGDKQGRMPCLLKKSLSVLRGGKRIQKKKPREEEGTTGESYKKNL